MSSMYTESPFALLSFLGMLWYVEKQYVWAALVWGLASGIRSNAIVYTGFFIYDLILRKPTAKSVFLACMCCSLTMAGFGMFQYYGYRSFCLGSSIEPRRPWCTSMPPLLYSFVQKHYWGNGFLAYYETKQIPNFLIAMPILCLSVAGIVRYARQDWHAFVWTLGLNDQERWKKSPFIYLWSALTAYSATCMHIQVIVRFFTSLPPLYWYIAQVWADGLGAASSRKCKWLAHGVLGYQVLYGLVGIVLFAAFLPPA
ncbi:GPI mannosyltransferase 2 [Dichotomocladium elegans]|nr:GPI mannosyltransferase 2 [Dichotomocladium elegans]